MYRFTILLIVIAVAAAVAADERKIMRVEFSEELDVDRLDGERYTSFIKNLRRRLAVEYLHGVPVLPVNNVNDPRGFDVRLTSGARVAAVRIHRDSLSLRGYQDQRDRRWFEFGRAEQSPEPLIEGSELLGFDNSYADLSAAAQLDMLDVSFNKDALRDAVSKLAESTNTQDRARALIVVTQMICEATRFVDVANHFASGVESAGPVRLPEWMMDDLQNNWEHLSYIVLKSYADPCYQFDPPTIHGQKIQNVDELINIMGIVMRCSNTLNPPCAATVYRQMKKVYGFKSRPIGPRMVVGA